MIVDVADREQAYRAICKLFENKNDDFKLQVLDAIVSTGVAIDDPVFMLLAQVVPFRLSLEVVPIEIKVVLDDFNDRLIARIKQVQPITAQELEQFKNEIKELLPKSLSNNNELQNLIISIDSLQDNIKSTISETIETKLSNKLKNLPTQGSPLVGGWKSNAILLAIALSFASISSALAWKAGTLSIAVDPGGPRPLTLEEVELLNWAKSDRAKKAKEIVNWNGEYLLSGACQKDAKQLGVVLTMNGRTAQEGFCVLWVKPYKERGWK